MENDKVKEMLEQARKKRQPIKSIVEEVLEDLESEEE